ncbi:MAG: hypothetical protein KGI84_06930 [Elusimicrobia bacterium]|nr:hypothetical protein [Elusimicrobiota bacterium]
MNALLIFLAASLAAGPARAGQSPDLSQAFSALSAQAKRASTRLKASDAQNHGAPRLVDSGGAVRLAPFVCAGSGISDAQVSADIARARKVLSQCGLKIAVSPAPYPRFSLPDGRCNLETDEGSPVFSSDERDLISRYRTKGAGVLTAFYLSWDSEDPNEAGTSIPADYAAEVKTAAPASLRRQALGTLFIFQKARETMGGDAYTLPHEMVHILTESSAHLYAPSDSTNLMYRPLGYASTSASQGSALTSAQCARIWQVSGQP